MGGRDTKERGTFGQERLRGRRGGHQVWPHQQLICALLGQGVAGLEHAIRSQLVTQPRQLAAVVLSLVELLEHLLPVFNLRDGMVRIACQGPE